VSSTLTTFLFELANFLLLVVLLGWLLFKPVRRALQMRQAAERQREVALDEQEKAAAKGRAELEASRAAFDRETARLRKDRLAAVEEQAVAIVARAREAAHREQERSQRIVLHLERAQVQQLSAAIAATTREAVARLLASLQASDLDGALLRSAGRQLEAVATDSLGAVLVESAAPLDEGARATMTGATSGHASSVEFRVVPELGAGLRVTTARGLIDASAAGIAAHAERVLVTALGRTESEAGA